jgi:hypothetical protein
MVWRRWLPGALAILGVLLGLFSLTACDGFKNYRDTQT